MLEPTRPAWVAPADLAGWVDALRSTATDPDLSAMPAHWAADADAGRRPSRPVSPVHWETLEPVDQHPYPDTPPEGQGYVPWAPGARFDWPPPRITAPLVTYTPHGANVLLDDELEAQAERITRRRAAPMRPFITIKREPDQ